MPWCVRAKLITEQILFTPVEDTADKSWRVSETQRMARTSKNSLTQLSSHIKFHRIWWILET